MLRMVVALGIAACVLGTAGCTSRTTTTNPPAEAEPTSPAESQESTPAEVAVPDGWTIDSVITEEEVGGITEKTMVYFPEASSAAQDGKPAAGYTNEGAPNTKLFISVDMAGGEAGYEASRQYVDDATVTELDGLGDKAYAGTFASGNVGIVVLSDGALIKIDWPPTAYGDDAIGMGSELAELLMSKMYQ